MNPDSNTNDSPKRYNIIFDGEEHRLERVNDDGSADVISWIGKDNWGKWDKREQAKETQVRHEPSTSDLIEYRKKYIKLVFIGFLGACVVVAAIAGLLVLVGLV